MWLDSNQGQTDRGQHRQAAGVAAEGVNNFCSRAQEGLRLRTLFGGRGPGGGTYCVFGWHKFPIPLAVSMHC